MLKIEAAFVSCKDKVRKMEFLCKKKYKRMPKIVDFCFLV